MGTGREFDRIRRFAEVVGDAARGWGDDAATLRLDDAWLVVSVDLSVEGVHFRRSWLSCEDIGWRAAMAAMSDLAADGAEPLGLLVSVGSPSDMSDGDVEDLMRGIGAAARAAGTQIVGGDLSTSGVLVVDCCALGRAERPVRRAGASPGDEIWVTGAFGAPRAALEAWRRGDEPSPTQRARFARPEARLEMGRWLAARGATAMIDVSDGLAQDAGHLAAASGVRVVLDLDRLPLAHGVSDPLTAAASGEEYELLAAMPPTFNTYEWTTGGGGLGSEANTAPVRLTRIGECVEGGGVETRLAGRVVPTPPGFDHFAR